MGIQVFEKNKIDLDVDNVSITASDSTVGADAGSSFVNYLRNRRNTDGWGTGGSSDAGDTTLIIDTTDPIDVDYVSFVGMNFKSYTFKYWDGASYVNFSTPINVSGNTSTTKDHSFTEVSASKFQLIITGTMTPDEDKLMAQLILTKLMGTFTTEPMVKKPKQERGKKVRKMLSGRSNVTRTIGAFSCTLVFPPMKVAADHALIEQCYEKFNGFIIRLNGGDTSNFFTDVAGWRLQDYYLMTCANELETEWVQGRFANGQQIEMQLVESRI